MQLNLAPLEKAIASLEAALSPAPRNDRERDGAIQRFEYTLELTWKTGQKLLGIKGIQSASPRAVVREMARLGMIDDPQRWFNFITIRNEASHIYKEEIANKVFSHLQDFLTEAKKLLKCYQSDVDASP